MNITEIEAIELGNKLYANITNSANNIIKTDDYIDFVRMATQAIENQRKIKDLLDSCTAWPDDMCDCLVEIEKILKE